MKHVMRLFITKVEEDRKFMFKLGAKVTPAVIFVNQQNRKIPMVGMNTSENFKQALRRSLRIDHLEARQREPLHKWLEKQDIIFTKEVEVMYDLQPENMIPFLERALYQSDYEFIPFQNTYYIKRI